MQERSETWMAFLTCLLCLAAGIGAQKGPEKLPDFAGYPVQETYKGKPAHPASSPTTRKSSAPPSGRAWARG
jgi:hypothetical protein